MLMLSEVIREILLLEAPIRDLEVIGTPMDKAGGGFSKQDRKLLSSPKAIEKIRSRWEKTPYVFDIFLLKVPQLNKPEFREIGSVSEKFMRQFEEITGDNVPNDPSAITILFNGNYGAEKVPMTAWIMAHRVGHAIRNTSYWDEYISEIAELTNNIFEYVYNKTLKMTKYGDLVSSGWERWIVMRQKKE
jgi:hypothetical protein